MAGRAPAPNEIAVGRPLPYAIHDRSGKLLLKQGEIIKNEDLMRAVLQRGVVHEVEVAAARDEVAAEQREVDIRRLPVFRRVRAMQDPLEHALALLRSERASGVQACVDLARTLREACDSDLDAALAAFQIDAAEEAAGAAARGVHNAVLVELVSRALGLPSGEREVLICAAFTHDIGMHPLCDALNRQRLALSVEQRQALTQHADQGCELLAKAGVSAPVWLEGVQQHHERADGSGYPRGLAGEQISLAARLLAIGDIYTAMIRPRAYRDAVQSREAMRQLFLERGRWVDEGLAATFIRELGVHPPGTLVRLENNEIAVVTRRGESAATPRLRVVLNAQGAPVPRSGDVVAQGQGRGIAGVVPMQRYRALMGRMPEFWEEARA